MQLYNRKISIGDRDLFERGLKYESVDDNDQAVICYIRAGVLQFIFLDTILFYSILFNFDWFYFILFCMVWLGLVWFDLIWFESDKIERN